MNADKRCGVCFELLPLESFHRRTASSDGRQSRCKECLKAWYGANKEQHIADVTRLKTLRTQDNRRRLREYLLAHPCVDCRESDLRVLDFDHRDRSLKRGMVSQMVYSAGWPRIAAEVALCDVRCANCHRRRTAQQLGYWSALLDERAT